MSHHGARQRLVDRAIERLVEGFLSSLSQVFTHAIEDDDRVVQRVTDDGKNRRDYRERYLEVHDLEERQSRDDVVRGRNQRRKSKTPLEADCQVHSRDKEREKHGNDCIPRELVADSRSHSLGPDDSNVSCTVFLLEESLDVPSDRFSAGSGGTLALSFARPDRKLAITSELLDLGADNSCLVEM